MYILNLYREAEQHSITFTHVIPLRLCRRMYRVRRTGICDSFFAISDNKIHDILFVNVKCICFKSVGLEKKIFSRCLFLSTIMDNFYRLNSGYLSHQLLCGVVY